MPKLTIFARPDMNLDVAVSGLKTLEVPLKELRGIDNVILENLLISPTCRSAP